MLLLHSVGIAGRNSSVGRAPDSLSGVAGSIPGRSGGRFFFSTVPVFIRCPLHPHIIALARKRLRSFCRKCRLQVTHKHACTLDPVGTYRGKRTHTQLIRECSSSVVSARWATVVWSWPIEWNCGALELIFAYRIRRTFSRKPRTWRTSHGPRYQRVLAICTLKKKKRGGTEGTNSSKILCSMFVYVLFYVSLCTGLILWFMDNLLFDDLRTE